MVGVKLKTMDLVKKGEEFSKLNGVVSVTEFTTDGSPLVVVYAGGSGKRDDLRPHRRGGYAVLNAFQLIQLSGATSPQE